MPHRGVVHPRHLVAHCSMVYRPGHLLASHGMPDRHTVVHSRVRIVIHRRVGTMVHGGVTLGAQRWPCLRGREFVLHAVVLGAHGDRLHVDGVLQPLEPPHLRRLHLAGMVVRYAFGAVGRRAGAAGAGDHPLDRLRTDHLGMVANMHHVVGPVEVDAGDMGLGMQGLLDRFRALQTIDIFKFERCVLFRV